MGTTAATAAAAAADDGTVARELKKYAAVFGKKVRAP